jgi:hypothetical protein
LKIESDNQKTDGMSPLYGDWFIPIVWSLEQKKEFLTLLGEMTESGVPLNNEELLEPYLNSRKPIKRYIVAELLVEAIFNLST